MERRYEIGISADGRYVYARSFREPHTLELAATVARELMTLGDPRAFTGCLIDLRGTTSMASAPDLYEFAYEKSKVIGMQPRWKTAVLKDVGDDSTDFLETVMKNAGFNVQMFESEQAAKSWLTGTPIP